MTAAKIGIVGVMLLVLWNAFASAAGEKSAPSAILLKGTARVEIKVEGDVAKARISADRRTRGTFVVTFLQQEPLMYSLQFEVDSQVSMTKSLPLSLEGRRKASFYRIDLFEEVPEGNCMRLADSVLLTRPEATPKQKK